MVVVCLLLFFVVGRLLFFLFFLLFFVVVFLLLFSFFWGGGGLFGVWVFLNWQSNVCRQLLFYFGTVNWIPSNVKQCFSLLAIGNSTSINNQFTYSFQPVHHNWCNKGRGMCYPVCGMVHIKEPLLLIGKSSPCGGSGFPISLSEWSFTICSTQYNRK